jgi:hypothetical protein
VSLVFFTDRDLGSAFPETLAASGLTVERHAVHFPPDCPDEEWLEVVGSRGWTALTRDARIRYKPNELAAVVRHRVALLVVVGNAPHAELAANFVRTVARITAFVGRHTPPFIPKVYRPTPADIAANPNAAGSVSLWYPKPMR